MRSSRTRGFRWPPRRELGSNLSSPTTGSRDARVPWFPPRWDEETGGQARATWKRTAGFARGCRLRAPLREPGADRGITRPCTQKPPHLSELPCTVNARIGPGPAGEPVPEAGFTARAGASESALDRLRPGSGLRGYPFGAPRLRRSGRHGMGEGSLLDRRLLLLEGLLDPPSGASIWMPMFE